MEIDRQSTDQSPEQDSGVSQSDSAVSEEKPREIGGREGPDPTRYGDWEKNGRCIDF